MFVQWHVFRVVTWVAMCLLCAVPMYAIIYKQLFVEVSRLVYDSKSRCTNLLSHLQYSVYMIVCNLQKRINLLFRAQMTQCMSVRAKRFCCIYVVIEI